LAEKYQAQFYMCKNLEISVAIVPHPENRGG
jgi:hypothetical protein